MVFLILYNTKCNTNDSNMMRTFKKGKKIKLPTGFEPVAPPYQGDALPPEPWQPVIRLKNNNIF